MGETTKMKMHSLYLVLWLAVWAALGAWLAVMSLDNQSPYYYIREGAYLTPNPAPQGAQMFVHWPIKVYRLCPGSVQRTLRDTITGKPLAAYDKTPSALSVQLGDTEINKTFLLPHGPEPDGLPSVVTYRATISFQCNLLQKIWPIRIETPELTFRVLPVR